MLPIDPLMSEHRLITRVIQLLSEELKTIRELKRVNLALLETVADFFRNYADRCHHGKEEFMLFRRLEKKDLSPEHQKIMAELVEDHVKSREWVDSLVNVTKRYAKGEKGAIREIQQLLQDMTEFAPRHMGKEEKYFLIPVMQYFSEEEKDALLKEEYDFDRTLIHEKYRVIIDKLEPTQSEESQKSKIIKSGSTS
jgi:hemerythrin-like domain-containing protein